MSIQLVVLAGGKGTRLGTVSEIVPKSLISVANKPFVEYQLSLFRGWDVHSIHFCLGYLGEKVIEFLEMSKFGIKTSFSLDGEILRGTGGAIIHAWDQIEDEFAVIYGDSYLPFNFSDALVDFRSSKESLMCVTSSPYLDCPNNVNVEEGFVTEYSKTDSPNEFHLIDYGLIFFHKEQLSKFRHKEKLDLSEILNNLVENNLLRGRRLQDRFYEVGTKNGIVRLEEFLSTI
jgi:NDP-sugar pyrophosphorylase family protein